MTRNPNRIDDVLEEVEQYWKEHPDLRLGQILMSMATRHGYEDCFYIEDYELVQEINRVRENNKNNE